MEATEIKHFIEAALLAAGRPLSIDQLHGLFDGRMAPEKAEIRKAIETKDTAKIQAEIAELEKELDEITKLIAMLKNLEK